MKKILLLGVILLNLNIALADGRDGRDGRGQGGPGAPGREPIPAPSRPGDGRDQGRDSDQIRMCQQDIFNLRRDLQSCQMNRIDPKIVDQLRFDNDQLRRENESLRHQLDQMNHDPRYPRDPRDQGSIGGLGFFSYAGCKNYKGEVDMKFLSSAEGGIQFEAETNSLQKVTANYNCSYGVGIVKSEMIRTTSQMNYCVAGCLDYTGNIDQKFIQSGRGRNQTEAEFAALKGVANTFNCSYGIKVQACQ